MKRRVFSMILVLVMVFGVLPLMSAPVLALTRDDAISWPDQQEGKSGSGFDGIGVMIRKTDIEADLAANNEGYGSLKTEFKYIYNEDTGTSEYIDPHAALINRDGEFVFPYVESTYRYTVNNGVISLTSMGDWVRVRGGDSVDWRKRIYPMGYYSLDGRELFSHNYIVCYPMRDGYAMVLEDQNADYENDVSLIKGYLVNEAGEVVYTFGNLFLYGGAGGGPEYGSYFSYWNPTGQFSEGVIPVEMGKFERDGIQWYGCGAWERQSAYYMDPLGNVVLDIMPYGYDEFYPFFDGLAVVNQSKGGNYGYIDKTGSVVIPFDYSSASGFQDGYAYVCDSNTGKWGYIDKRGNTVIPFEYEGAYGYGDGLFAVMKNEKYGLVDENNKVVVPFEYDDISSFENSVAYAIKDGFVHIITRITGPIAIDGEEMAFDVHSSDTRVAVYAAEGEVTSFTVSCANACVVAYTTDGGATYTRLAAGGSGDTRSFSVDVTKEMTIVVALKGDLNLDGKVALADAAQAKRYCAGLRTLTAEQMLAADVVIDGEIKLADAAQIQRFCSGLRAFEW